MTYRLITGLILFILLALAVYFAFEHEDAGQSHLNGHDIPGYHYGPPTRSDGLDGTGEVHAGERPATPRPVDPVDRLR